MRMIVTATVLLLGLVTAANAQTLADCKRIAADSQRLACYDRLADGPGGATTPQSGGPRIMPSAPADPAVASAENAVRKNLKDPGSAQFVALRRRGDALCGFVNARGDTGSKLFVYVEATGQSHVLTRPEDDPAGAAARAAYAAHCR